MPKPYDLKIYDARDIAVIEGYGFVVGDRDPRYSTALEGKYMIAQPLEEHELPTEDARAGGWCVVGDDMDDLIAEAYNIQAEAREALATSGFTLSPRD